MDGKDEDKRAEQLRFESGGFPGGARGARESGDRTGPTWRAWVISIVAAVVLSAAATLLLGGSFRLPGGSNAAAGGCGSASGGPCCPPQDAGGR